MQVVELEAENAEESLAFQLQVTFLIIFASISFFIIVNNIFIPCKVKFTRVRQIKKRNRRVSLSVLPKTTVGYMFIPPLPSLNFL